MGEMAEYHRDMELEARTVTITHKPRYWKTQDGRRVLPRELDTTHLKNILNMVIRNHQVQVLCNAVASYAKGYTNTGEWQATHAADPRAMREHLIADRPVLLDIEAELIRRGAVG